MNKLPKWVIPSKFPALFDLESATAIEMTAKLYGTMQEMIDDYNKFVEAVNENIEAFENGVIASNKEFSVGLRQEFQDFIDVVELRISEAENYMKTNIDETTANTINRAIEKGSLRITEEYDEATESYNIKLTGGV